MFSLHHDQVYACQINGVSNSFTSEFRSSPSEFVISLAKYVKAVYHTQVSVGMRFRMLFETEDSSIRRYVSGQLMPNFTSFTIICLWKNSFNILGLHVDFQ